MSVSVGTLMLAIKTINHDSYREYVLDLNKALSELSSLYEAERRQHEDVELPSVEHLRETS
ncbi:MAG: hypothetical protein DMG15_10790 [Acidobacteria bacterium]|nr:MAG: hypothetical protein DMG15_10790 [Acidobacteriota bacterium]